MELPIKNIKINKFRRKCRSKCGLITIFIIFFIIFIFELVILSIMVEYNRKFWIDCPFTITGDYNLHYKRRCELYGLNYNSRYLNQYICSYDPYKDFEYEYKSSGKHSYKVPKKLKKKIKPDYVRCVKLKNIIPDNTIITLFNNEYESIDKFYCSRTNRPKKNSLINDKDCNDKVKHVFIYILYGFNFLKMFLIPFFIGYLSKVKTNYDYDIYQYNRNYNVRNNNNRNNNDNNMDNNNNENNSTKGSEDINKNNNNISMGFVNQETKNIIIVKKEENIFEDNIRDSPYDNKNDMKNDSLDNAKKSSPDKRNNEVKNNNQNDANNKSQKQSQERNTNPDDEDYGDKN
jgi:hypothetical protein